MRPSSCANSAIFVSERDYSRTCDGPSGANPYMVHRRTGSPNVPRKMTIKAPVAIALTLALMLAACGDSQRAQQSAPPPPTVTVATPVQRAVIDYDEYVGRFVAVDTVEVRARVSGYLDGIHFNDGQIVKQGD